MFANKITKVVTVKDGDEDVSVTIRKLSARSLDKASLARQAAIAETARTLGPDMLKAFQDADAKKDAVAILDPAEARYGAYDRGTTLTAGIASWTAKIDLQEGINELDEDTADFLFKEIVALSVPTPEEQEAASGKS